MSRASATLALWVWGGLLAHASMGHAAPRTPYGGTLTLHVFGEVPSPLSLDSWANRSLHRAVFEPLYDLTPDGQLVPLLADGLPTVSNRMVTIALKQNISLHDGRTLTPAHVVDWLGGLAHETSMAPHVTWPIARTDTGRLKVRVAPMQNAVQIELVAPSEHYPWLLTQVGVGVVTPPSQQAVGTGPFRPRTEASRTAAFTLEPFLEHHRGRPFIDTVRFEAVRSSFTAKALLQKPTTTSLGAPESCRAPNARCSPTNSTPAETTVLPPPELVILRVGPTLDDTLQRGLGAVIRRPRSIRRLSSYATPAPRLLGGLPAPPPPTQIRASNAQIRLLVAKDGRIPKAFAQRLQFDLVKAGFSRVVLDRVDGPTFEARSNQGRYDLLLDTLELSIPSNLGPVPRLLALMEIAARYGALGAIPKDALGQLDANPERAQANLDLWERTVRTRTRLVPIAIRPPGVVVSESARDIFMHPLGALRVDNAYLPRAVTP